MRIFNLWISGPPKGFGWSYSLHVEILYLCWCWGKKKSKKICGRPHWFVFLYLGRIFSGLYGFLRATSHTNVKAHDHCNVRILIGWKGRDRPNSFHTRTWRFKIPMKSSWMKSLHGVLHGKLWIKVNGLPKFASNPHPRDRFNANCGRSC